VEGAVRQRYGVSEDDWISMLGRCDGNPQVRAIQNRRVAEHVIKCDESEPALGDPHAMDLVDVNCSSDGCNATRDAHVTIR
jgi:hypothetical protein